MNKNLPLKTDTRSLVDPSYPIQFVAAIYNADNLGQPTIWGTGSVIAPNKILTAAHVVEQLKKDTIYVATGKHFSNPVVLYDISDISIHPDYDGTSSDFSQHDLAIITTSTTLPTEHYNIKEVVTDLSGVGCGCVGYPYDLITTTGQFNQYADDFSISSVSSNYIGVVSRYSSSGQSGSGLFGKGNNDYNGTIIGVLSASNANSAPPEDPDHETHYTLLTGSNYTYVSENI